MTSKEAAAAQVFRLAQAHALLRLYRESVGRDAESTDDLLRWVAARPPEQKRPIEPTEADYEAARRENPLLAATADAVQRAGRVLSFSVPPDDESGE
jgi:hypothetical protein